jgi:hypothetical protein
VRAAFRFETSDVRERLRPRQFNESTAFALRFNFSSLHQPAALASFGWMWCAAPSKPDI